VVFGALPTSASLDAIAIVCLIVALLAQNNAKKKQENKSLLVNSLLVGFDWKMVQLLDKVESYGCLLGLCYFCY